MIGVETKESLVRENDQEDGMENHTYQEKPTWHEMLNYSSTMIQSISLAGDLLYFNETLREALGYKEEELKRKTIWSLLHWDSQKTYESILGEIQKGHAPAGDRSLSFVKASGEVVMLTGTITLARDSEGTIIGTTEFYKTLAVIDGSYNINIHENMPALKKELSKGTVTSYDGSMIDGLEDLGSPINRFLDSIYDLVFFKDIHGIYRGCNKNFAEFTGLTKNQIIGHSDYDLYAKDVADLFLSKDEQIFRDLTPRKNEEWVHKVDGSRSFVETLKTPYFGPHNTLMGVLGISRDITERKLAEEKLAENERMLNIYFTQSISGKFFMMLDEPVKWVMGEGQEEALVKIYKGLRMQRINPAMVSLYNISEDALLEDAIVKEVFTDLEEGKDHWMELLNHGNHQMVVKKERKNGKHIYISSDYTCLYDSYGQVLGIFGNQRDITSEVRAEKERKSRERFLQKVLETAKDGYYAVDQDLIITDVNEAYCRMSGYSREEIIGTSVFIHTIAEEEEEAVKRRTELILKEGSALFESRHRRKDGSAFDVEISVSVLEDDKTIFINFIRDITERKQLESFFLIEKDLFKNTIHSAADAVISTDDEGKVVIMNNMAEYLTGWVQEEATGKYLEDVLNITDKKGYRTINIALETMKKNEAIELSEDHKLISKDCSEVFVELTASPISGSNNSTIGAVVMFKDVTKRREEMKNLEDLSYRDALTGLHNRRYLNDFIKNLDDKLSMPLTIMVVDVNGLKLTNDAFGHSTGDELLRTVAGICKEVTRIGDIVCRTGGDEFVLLLPNSDRAQAKALKDRIVSVASKTHVDSLQVSLAIGYSVMRSSEDHFEELFTEADNNMYRNKLRYGKTVKKRTMEKLVHKLGRTHPEVTLHSQAVATLASKFAQALGYDEKQMEKVYTAGKFHDIGKVMVPKELLHRMGKLSDKELTQVRKHAEIGYQLLKEVDDYKHLAEIVLSHHEWWNGTGYPQNIKGKDIPEASRIIAIADAYETMTGKHSYRQPMSKEEAILELRKYAGTQFDPELTELFIEKIL